MHFPTNFCSLVTYCISLVSAVSIEIHHPRPLRPSTSDIVTPNVLSLRQITVPVASNKVVIFDSVRALASGNMATHKPQTIGTSVTSGILSNQIYVTNITLGNQVFVASLDTGSSDTWIVGNNFTCLDMYSGDIIETKRCRLGQPFDKKASASFKELNNVNFNASYGDGEYIAGVFGMENVTLAGLQIRSQIAVVQEAAWQGDNITSGLIGLAYPYMTRQYAGNNSHVDNEEQGIKYDPILTTMFKQNLTSPVFSLALTHGKGLFALGGVPPQSLLKYNTSVMARAPIEIWSAFGAPVCLEAACPNQKNLSEYAITLSASYYNRTTGPLSSTLVAMRSSTSNSPRDNIQSTLAASTSSISSRCTSISKCTPSSSSSSPSLSTSVSPKTSTTIPTKISSHPSRVTSAPFQAIIDSGTSSLFVPSQIASDTNSLFHPPAIYNSTLNQYVTLCNATLPTDFVFVIGNVALPMRTDDLLIPSGDNDGKCFSQVIDGQGLYIIGNPFLRNVLAVFDVGGGEMRFYPVLS